MKNKTICMVLLVFLFSLTTVSAISYNLGPEVEVFNTETKSLNLEDIDKKENLVFKVTLTNEKNYWLCSKHWSITLRIDKENTDEPKNLNWAYIEDNEEFCLAPKKEFVFWLVFDEYNKLEEDNRMGDWTINPTINVFNPVSRLPNDMTKMTSTDVEKQGKFIDFTITKDDPSTNPEWDNFWDSTTGIILKIGAICAAVLAIIGLITWIVKSFK